MIEEHTTIDSITTSKDGKIQLVIMDAGLTTEPEERFHHLIEKLKSYVYYVIAGDFKTDYPDKAVEDVSILVICRIPPTNKMLSVNRLGNPTNESEGLSVTYKEFPESCDNTTNKDADIIASEPTIELKERKEHKLSGLTAKRPFPIIPRRWRIAAWIAVVVGLIASLVATYQYQIDQSLLKDGAKEVGKINSFDRSVSNRGLEFYRFDISWKDTQSNQTYRKSFTTSSAAWSQPPPKSMVTVIYDRKDPRKSEIYEAFHPKSEMIAVGLIVTLIGLIASGWIQYTTKKNLIWLENELPPEYTKTK